jgi:hypothetical protein
MTTAAGGGRAPDRPPPVPSTPGVLLVPMQSRRINRGLLLQKMQHAVPAVPLLFQGLKVLGDQAHGFELALGVTEVVTSAFLLSTVARALRAARSSAPAHAAHGIDWAHVWAAGVLFAEAGERWHLNHHVARPVILTAIFTLALGIFHGKVMAVKSRRRQLRIDDDGICVTRGPRRRWTSTWQELADVTITEKQATLRTRKGSERRIDLADLFNAAEVTAALVVARERLDRHKTGRELCTDGPS